MVDPLIIVNIILIFITGVYTFLTYKILKSNEKIAKLNLDPILWVNLLTDEGVYIEKLKEYPAYNIVMEFSIQVPEISKAFNPLVTYLLGSIIEKEKTFSLDFEERIETYLKKKGYGNPSFILRCITKYNIGVDKSLVKRVEYLYGNAEEIENGEMALGFSYEKDSSIDDEGDPPKKIISFGF